MRKINIAIDGTAGSGKGTVARLIAQRLGYVYFDTWAMYRGLAYLLDQRKVDFENMHPQDLDGIELAFAHDNHLVANSVDIEAQIRTEQAGVRASLIGLVPLAREFLVSIQQKYAADKGCVMEGRDIGSVVLPDAEVKFFMTASDESRAQRRLMQLQEKGAAPIFDEVLAYVRERDTRDTQRPISPLVQVPEAILVDSSEMNIPQTVEFMMPFIQAALGEEK